MLGERYRILYFDGKNWNAERSFLDTNFRLVKAFFQSKNNLSEIFDSLKANKIFTLPDQTSLKLDVTVHDRVSYKLEFKVNNLFRSYEFNNPCTYLEFDSTVSELKYYCEITRIFSTLK
jgi:hypothetical protein